jgi:hypothetical protein
MSTLITPHGRYAVTVVARDGDTVTFSGPARAATRRTCDLVPSGGGPALRVWVRRPGGAPGSARVLWHGTVVHR